MPTVVSRRGLKAVVEELKAKGVKEVNLVLLPIPDEVCFSPNCYWIKAKIRCAGCPYIDEQGNIKDKRVGGS